MAQIEKYSIAGRVRFDEDELVRVWILHHLEIIGEACAGFSGAFRIAHPDEIWRDAVGFRSVLAHQYFGPAGKRAGRAILRSAHMPTRR